MSNPTVVHRIRQITGGNFQPRYGPVLFDLELELRGMGLDHPYRLVRNKIVDQMRPLLGVPEFASGATGPLGTTHADYVYHLTSVRKLLTFSRWRFFPSGFPTLKHQDWRLFEYLIDDYDSSKDWLPLKKYSQGTYSGFRDFTWWTNLSLLRTQIVCQAHKLGLPNKWIPKYGVILRCHSSYAKMHKLPHGPSVVDGFTSEIFRPSDCRAAPPASGRTIDLDSPGALRDGAEEFVLTPVRVEAIEFQPVLIDIRARSKHVVVRNARLWQLLEMFYNSL